MNWFWTLKGFMIEATHTALVIMFIINAFSFGITILRNDRIITLHGMLSWTASLAAIASFPFIFNYML